LKGKRDLHILFKPQPIIEEPSKVAEIVVPVPEVKTEVEDEVKQTETLKPETAGPAEAVVSELVNETAAMEAPVEPEKEPAPLEESGKMEVDKTEGQ